MPRDPFKPLTVNEQRFVLHYVREGATPEVAHIAERKARLPKGEAKSYLRRRHVMEEISRRQRLVEYEQNKLIAKEAIDQTKREDERDQVTLHKIEVALDKVIALDAEKHGQTVLKGIELGLIYTGAIRDGNKVKLSTVDPLGKDGQTTTDPDEPKAREEGFYTSIFAGLKNNGGDGGAAPAAATVEPAPLMPDEKEQPPAPRPPQPPKAAPVAKPAPAKASQSTKKSSTEIEIT